MNHHHLVLDIGNTSSKISVFASEIIIESLVATSIEEISRFISSISYQNCIISSVADQMFTKKITDQLENHINLTYQTPLPVKNNYNTPQTLGNDRIANAVGAFATKSNTNSLIIDAGTCLKFDFINSKNEYLGGSIAPGIEMRFKALQHFTAKLPIISEYEPLHKIGTTTYDSMIAGCYFGTKNEIQATIDWYQQNFENLHVYFTGGDTAKLEKMDFSQKNSIFADRWLTSRGLNEILNYNVKK